MNKRLAAAAKTGLVSFTAALLMASCGGSPAPSGAEVPSTDGPATDGPGAEGPATDDAPETAWVDMDMDQKKKHMMDEVVPHMASVFQTFDGERYGTFNCGTCHGPGAKTGEFAMPSPALPKLPPNGDFAALMEKKPKVVEFMMQKVGPEMAGTIGMQPYDPKTNEGFGCYGCHQSE